MIIFGTRGKVITGGPCQTTCTSCGNGAHTTFGVLRYFHVFWIPVILFSRTVGIECDHCQHTLSGKDVPDIVARQAKSSIFTAGRTWPYFTGLMLILLLGAGIYLKDIKRSSVEESYLAAPMVNDYYVIDFRALADDQNPEYPYGVLHVIGVHADVLDVLVSDYSYNMYSAASQAITSREVSASDYWADGTFTIDRSFVNELKSEGNIPRVHRVGANISGVNYDQVSMVAKTDPAMQEAIRKARDTVDTFIGALSGDEADTSGYSVKVPITDGENTEHFWMVDIELKEGAFVGLIDNTPRLVDNVEEGQSYTVPVNEISDWMYFKNGVAYGGTTVKALFPTMSAEEAAEIKKSFGWE